MVKFSYPSNPFIKKRGQVKRFKLLGERCSGTYYAQRLIEHNFDLPHTDEYGHKHFWSFRKEKYPNDLLLVFLVREPFSWLESFYQKKWHVPEHFHSLPFSTFVTEEYHSIKDHNLPNVHGELGSEIMADRNPHTNKRYESLFHLRHNKMSFIFHEFPKMCNNMIVLRLEDFQEDFEKQLTLLEETFHLRRSLPSYENLHHYKGNKTLPIYEPKPLSLTEAEISLVERNLNHTWEDVLSYRKIVT